MENIDLFPSFKDFIKTGHMHYDYTHQRIIVSNPEYDVCFVFNMKDKVWTTMDVNVLSAINSYPQAYAMATMQDDNLLIDFTIDGSSESIGMPYDGYILTRPIKLDEPDSLKTIRTVVARGNFSPSRRTNNDGSDGYPVDMILYGSRDMYNWFTIASSKGPRIVSKHGTPYRYFRVGLITHLKDGESLSRLTIEYELKLQNKVR